MSESADDKDFVSFQSYNIRFIDIAPSSGLPNDPSVLTTLKWLINGNIMTIFLFESASRDDRSVFWSARFRCGAHCIKFNGRFLMPREIRLQIIIIPWRNNYFVEIFTGFAQRSLSETGLLIRPRNFPGMFFDI